MPDPALWLWRHPRPEGGAGRCYGRTDLRVDRRRAKRLAHRIRQTARCHALPREVWTSPLARCREVGRWLRRWGWAHHVESALSELDFGRWEGRLWSELPRAEIDAWVQDFAQHAPGGGEALPRFAERVGAFMRGGQAAARPVLVVAHGGWMVMARWQAEAPRRDLTAGAWSAAPGHGICWRLALPPAFNPASSPMASLSAAAGPTPEGAA